MLKAHVWQPNETKGLAILAFAAILLASAIFAGNAYAAKADSLAIEAASSSAGLQQQAASPSISYRVKYGSWEGWAKNGSVAGKNTGKAFVGAAIKLKGVGGGVNYKTKGVGASWQGAKANGKPSGSSAWKKGVEALSIKLTGKAAKAYDVYYRVRMSGTGWQTWRMNGQVAGVEGKGSRVVSMEVNLVKKNAKSFKARTGTVHIFNVSNGSDLASATSGNKMKVVNIKKNLKVPGAVHPGSNTVVNAKGKKITFLNNGAGFFVNEPTKANYKDLVNFTLRGGTWQSASISKADAEGASPLRITHASNIELLDFTIKDGYRIHAVELIACKDVDVCGVNLLAQGKCPSDCTDSQLQIDLADPTAAPHIPKKLNNGAPSKDIFVYDCTVKGARGINSNWAYASKKNCKPKSFHSNIVVKNCTITGKTAEALSIFNCVSTTISGNKITTNAKYTGPRDGDANTIGCHVAYQSDEVNGPSAKKSYKITIKNNTVKGGRNGIQVWSHNDAKFGTVTITGNKVYWKGGGDDEDCIHANEDQALSLDVSDNSEKDW